MYQYLIYIIYYVYQTLRPSRRRITKLECYLGKDLHFTHPPNNIGFSTIKGYRKIGAERSHILIYYIMYVLFIYIYIPIYIFA